MLGVELMKHCAVRRDTGVVDCSVEPSPDLQCIFVQTNHLIFATDVRLQKADLTTFGSDAVSDTLGRICVTSTDDDSPTLRS